MDPFDVELLGVADFDFWLRLLGRGDALFVDWQGCRITEHAGRASHSLFWSGDFMRGQLEVARRHLGPGQAKSTLTALLGGRCLWYGLRGLGSFRIGSARVHMNLLRRYGISLPKAIQGLLVAVRHRAMYRLSTGSSLAPPAPKPDIEILRSLGYDVTVATKLSEVPRHTSLAFVWWWTWLWLVGPVLKRRNIPIVATGALEPEIYDRQAWYKKLLIRQGLKYVDKPVFVSRYMIRELEKRVTLQDPLYSPHIVMDEYCLDDPQN
ncbi:D-inositol 3-phosphate glycosyltransferase, partial [Durusdinium trenchii]